MVAQASPRRRTDQATTRPTLKALLVENTGAGGGTGSSEALPRQPGLDRKQPRHPRAFVRQHAAQYDRVVVRGGDGTVSAVARGLLESGSQAALAVVPGGTGNDFAAALGLPEDPEEALQLALTGRTVAIDLGTVNGRPFVNAVTLGPAAEVSHNTGKKMKALLGRFAYVFETLRHPGRLNAFDARIDADGQHLDSRFVFIGIANGRSVGGGTQLAPRAMLTDGRLDLVLIPDAPKRQLAGAFRALRNGDDHPLLERRKVRDLELTMRKSGVSVSRDGEPMRARRLRFEILRRALRVVVPKA